MPDPEEVAAVRRARFSGPLDHLMEVPSDLEIQSAEFTGPTATQRAAYREQLIYAATEALPIIPGHYVVWFNDEAFPYRTPAATFAHPERVDAEGYTLTARAMKMTAAVGGEVHRIWNHAIGGFMARLDPEQARQLRNHPMVRSVTPDLFGEDLLEQEDPPSWGLPRIGNRNPTSENIYRYFFAGDGVTIYVFDSGFDTQHPEFINSNQGNHYAAVDLNDAGIQDFHGHGTAVGGLTVTPTYGVAKDAKLSAIKIRDLEDVPDPEPRITVPPLLTAALDGANWILNEDYDEETDLAVANFSVSLTTNFTEEEFEAFWGDYPGADYQEYLDSILPFEAAIENMLQAGIVIVAAAGNRGAESYDHRLPQRVSGVITVGASTSDDVIWQNSNWGNHVTLFAPGANVMTTMKGGGDVGPSGTSGAAPHVAGVAATFLQQYPSASPSEITQKILEAATAGKLSDATEGFENEPPPQAVPNKLLFRSLWWYPYHTFAEWEHSDTDVSDNHWFLLDEMPGQLWTNDDFYPWFYRDWDGLWMEYILPDPFLTFHLVTDPENPQNYTPICWDYWMEAAHCY